MQTTTRLSISAALLLAVALCGCSAGGGSTSALAPVVAEATPSAAPTPTEIPGDTNGDGKLSEREKEILAKNAPRDFTLTDGTVVIIDPQAPLPAEVVAALKERLIAPTEAYLRSSSEELPARMGAIRDELALMAAETGKGVIATFESKSNDGSGEVTTWGSVASDIQRSPVQSLRDRGQLVAEVEAWAASRNFAVLHIE